MCSPLKPAVKCLGTERQRQPLRNTFNDNVKLEVLRNHGGPD